jgi:predicted site-specific integrase-resolvase
MTDKLYRTNETARRAGIALVTLQRWIAAGKVDAPELRIRNGRAVRLWTMHDVDRLSQAKLAIYCRGRGRKKRSK